MFRASIVIGLILFLFTFTGCSRTVKFTAAGKAVCPYCYASVKEYSEFCEKCKRSFRWTSEVKNCWACNGTHICSSCEGSGQIFSADGLREKCTYCKGKGYCRECREGGYVVYGKSLKMGN